MIIAARIASPEQKVSMISAARIASPAQEVSVTKASRISCGASSGSPAEKVQRCNRLGDLPIGHCPAYQVALQNRLHLLTPHSAEGLCYLD